LGTKVTLNLVTAGYSTTPLAKKLGVKSGHRLALVGAPAAWTVDDLPDDVRLVRRRSPTRSDVVVAFFNDAASLRREIEGLSGSIVANGALWVAWPRRAGGHSSDITDNLVRECVLPLGLVDVKVTALDEDWSALKMMWRKELRDEHA
jgi:hypothetical protein